MNKKLKNILKSSLMGLTLLLCSCHINVLDHNNNNDLKKVRADTVLNNNLTFVSGQIYNDNTNTSMDCKLTFDDANGFVFVPLTRGSTSQVIFNTASNGNQHIILNFNINDIVLNPITPFLLSFNMVSYGPLPISNAILTCTSNDSSLLDDYSCWVSSFNNGFDDIPVALTSDIDTGYTMNNYSTYYNSDAFYNYSNYILTLDFEINVSRTCVFTNNVNYYLFRDISITNYSSLLPDEYERGYGDGFEVGSLKGESLGKELTIRDDYNGKTYQQIYTEGVLQGERNTQSFGSLLPTLFGSLVNIPISVLNGLAPLTFFDLSIIKVVITLLMLNVILWIIRKVLI